MLLKLNDGTECARMREETCMMPGSESCKYAEEIYQNSKQEEDTEVKLENSLSKVAVELRSLN